LAVNRISLWVVGLLLLLAMVAVALQPFTEPVFSHGEFYSEHCMTALRGPDGSIIKCPGIEALSPQ
jgi:hypothetical protein